MSEILYHITAKLFCKQQATAFLINENTAITARHAVTDKIENQTPIRLEFYGLSEGQETKEVFASIIGESKRYDVAILRLEKSVKSLESWPNLSSQKVNLEDNWECVGFPVEWDSGEGGSRFCYIKGGIYQDSSFEQLVKYDLHLDGTYINDGWDESLKGLSGSPVMVNGEIKAIVVVEEDSFIKSPIKSISINRIVNFLEQYEIKFNSSFGPKNNLINSRLDSQRNKCEELFKKVDYYGSKPDVDLLISAYYLKYSKDGTSQMKQFSEYLADSISDYACTLADLEKLEKRIIKPLPIIKRTNHVIGQIQGQEKLGAIILWMLVEGILGAPKGLKRISIDDEHDVFNELHIGMNTDYKLVLYLGEGKLKSDLKTAVHESIQSLGKIMNMDNDIFYLDDYFYDQIDSSEIKKLLSDFNKFDRRWDDIVLELTVFTGYDSDLLKKIEQRGLPKEHTEAFLEQKYIEECIKNEQIICEMLTENSPIKNIKINWFTIPFNTIEAFENLFFTEIT
ncbi:hypothetical protein COA08_23580 [Bacillus cereus]|uniref:Anti-bacteriophage protein A/HamA C-terminal domain-containing protein n=1 Tax=Bacillus cereus TaxID=1396 RepID=A0A2C0EHN2_BACCE|nr:Hachiman antiphage defense system protein HamA [Bacillus cereus]PGQ05934.1 hypothetical protein COA08_23580 [Bacillus cereus]